MNKYKDWIVRFYASHKDIPKGHSDCETLTELVRCKDCKHKRLQSLVWVCPFGMPGGKDFFCGYGETEECTQ